MFGQTVETVWSFTFRSQIAMRCAWRMHWGLAAKKPPQNTTILNRPDQERVLPLFLCVWARVAIGILCLASRLFWYAGLAEPCGSSGFVYLACRRLFSKEKWAKTRHSILWLIVRVNDDVLRWGSGWGWSATNSNKQNAKWPAKRTIHFFKQNAQCLHVQRERKFDGDSAPSP